MLFIRLSGTLENGTKTQKKKQTNKKNAFCERKDEGEGSVIEQDREWTQTPPHV